jgi:hypothetical protein
VIELVPQLAHAGHWLVSVAYAVPALLLPGAVLMAALDRRRERRDRRNGEAGAPSASR